MTTRTLHVASGHTLHLSSIEASDLPPGLEHTEDYTKFYIVRNWDAEGCVFFYLAKGHEASPKEIVVWYAKGAFWSGCGKNFKDAIEGAQRDGWLYA